MGVCVSSWIFTGNVKGTKGGESYQKPANMNPIQAAGMCVHVRERGLFPAQQD